MVNLNDKDDIVISGMSGTFPCSENITQFENNLYNKINMVTEDGPRWKHTDPLLPRLGGRISDLDKFDATFFSVHQIQADNMDPQSRVLIEEAFKAVLDAGINPNSLRESNTGVYIGSCFSESQNYLLYDITAPSGFGVTGCSKAMFANRISYVMGLTGPSLVLDTACSTGIFAIDLAYHALRNGEIDAAIVGAANIALHPNTSLHFAQLGDMAINGHCRPFDEESNGYTRSEAISCIFLQRKSAAKRVYATIVDCATNCDGYKCEGVTFPSRTLQEKLLRQVYSRTTINLDDLGYLEAHGTGAPTGDQEECAAIDEAICQRRNRPLLVGSVKSNCGHTEAASGICGLVKTLLAMDKNMIAPNINLKNVRKSIRALSEGRLKVVTEPTVLPKPYAAINSFGFGGANAHLVLKQFEKEKSNRQSNENTLPRLVTWSSRTEENCNEFFSYLANRPLDGEFLALLQNAQSKGIQGMVFRGYSILEYNDSNENPVVLNTNVQHNTGIKRPLVWVFSGMGSQWVGMGKTLMQLPRCKQSIQASHKTLLPMGVDLIKIITSDDPHMFDNIIHSFVGIGAIQIALVDMLKELGIVPDFVIGHSVGELGCAYADNCFTAEQMILASYYRGKVSSEVSKIRGSMAAIGMGYKDIKAIVPETIDVACHNSSESCTISGPQKDITEFVESLKAKGIFAKEVQCSNIAYHSRYISQFGPELFKYLKKIIPNPAVRSNKWICTSVPRSKWLMDTCKYCSAEYHTNNLLNSVLFEEALNFIPKNALTIEIAPHSLLQSILKGSVSDGVHIGLTKRNAKDGKLHFLNALGSLYLNGLEIRSDELYPKVSWPVSRGTPSISSLIKFDHSRDYFVYSHGDTKSGSGNEAFWVRLSDPKYKYLAGHEIDGQIVIPAAFYLECVWRTFAGLKGVDFDNLSVEFENVDFVRSTMITSANDEIEIYIFIHKGTGKFEITESKTLVATGFIYDIIGKTKPTEMSVNDIQDNHVILRKNDFYREMKLRGYHYNGVFQSIELAIDDGSYGKIQRQPNWVVVIDSMLQLCLLNYDSRSLMLPSKARTLRIYPQYHKSLSEQSSTHEIFNNKLQKKTICGGIEIIGLRANSIQRKKPASEAILEKYQFVPHFPAPKLCLDDAARCCIQIVLENQPLSRLQIVEFANKQRNCDFLKSLKQSVNDLPLVTGIYVLCHNSKEACIEEIEDIKNVYSVDGDLMDPFIVVLSAGDLSSLKSQILKVIDSNGFLIIRERSNLNIERFSCPAEFVPIAFFPTNLETFVLLQRNEQHSASVDVNVLHVSSSDDSFEWLPKLQEMCKQSKNVILVSQNEKFNGLLGLTNCLRKEHKTSQIRCVLIDDPKAPLFNPNLDVYKNQLNLNLALNVYRNNKWGTYRHLQLKQNIPTIQHSNHVYGSILRFGDLSTLKWIEGPLQKSDINVKIVYSSLNDRDVMIASGHLPVDVLGVSRIEQDCIFGLEYSGIEVKSGNPIMGMVPKAAVGSHLRTDTMLAWQVPQGWSLSEAATVPVAYLTVYYAFFFTVDITQGKSILINDGTEGVGLAAIRVALAYGLEVYTTVNSSEKKAFLLKTFPSLKENRIGNSLDTSFEVMVIEETGGKGVNFVLNSLTEDKLLASVRCLGRRGHFLEIGKFDMANDNNLALGVFLNELSFHAVIADNLFTASKDLISVIKELINKDIARGIIQPLPLIIFKAHDIEQAFKHLMSDKHIGKVMIEMRDKAESDSTLPISVLPRIYFSSKAVYIVSGGLGSFGLELVDWMILRGARKIMINSRRGVTNDYQKLRISLWKKYSCKIVVNTSNITTEEGCLQLLNDSMALGPIAGIFNLAVVLKNAALENQTKQNFEMPFHPKAIATKLLDQLSRKLCPNLEHFVVDSSISCGRGNAGQTNFGMANSIMERIIEDRVANGLPGKAIQWGVIGEDEGQIDSEIGGTLQQRIGSCLEVLDVLLPSTNPIVSSMVLAEKKTSITQKTAIDYVLDVLNIDDIQMVSLRSTLLELGLDAVMAIEVQQTLKREYNVVLNVSDIRFLTINQLKELSIDKAD